jgi:hypothetical protein
VVTPRRDESGKARIGCLFAILVVVLVVYAVKDFGAVYWRYYQLVDVMKSQASFAPGLTDQAIRDRLVLECDTLNIPLGPKQWEIKRTRSPNEITISATYTDSVVINLPVYHRVFYFHFTPSTSAGL